VREAAGDEDAVLLPGGGATFTARVDPQTRARVGSPLRLAVDPRKFHYFDAATGLRVEPAAVPALA
jgi:multiple sugar transport system ATP-binding protein